MSGSGLRVRITIAVMIAALLPVGVFGLLLGASETLAAALSFPVALAIFLAYILSFHATYESLVEQAVVTDAT